MAGQGTLADEVVLSGKGPFDAAFLQIGGGGMAAGVSSWLKTYWPNISIHGVEGVGQASMNAAFKANQPTPLPQVDLFCDGTAVRKAGELPFQICKQTLDHIDTVTNAEVSQAMRILWEGLRCISEPSGAMGLAAVIKQRQKLAGQRVLVILCGANIDFVQLGRIAQSVGNSNELSQTLRIKIPERPGAMLELLENGFADVSISDFQYGKTHDSIAWPIFTLTAPNQSTFEALEARLHHNHYDWEWLNETVDVAFRAIPLHSNLLSFPTFLHLDFHERQGALADFLAKRIQGNANLCYFNYRQSGERIGRALIGLDFPSPYERDALLMTIPHQGEGYRRCEPVDAATHQRLIGCIDF